jgi:hypothetical protein
MSAVVSSNQPRDMKFIQLGFPAVFSEYAAKSGLPTAYFGNAIHGVQMEANDDSVQGQYQEQKMLDAKREVLNRINNNASIQSNLLRNGGLPQYVKPMLSQRRFANPSMGAFADIYSARPNMVGRGGSESNFDSHLSGGVLRTAEGQRWIKNVLQERVNQLNVIDSDVAKFTKYSAPEFAETTQEKAISQGLSEAAGIKLHLELSALLSAFASAIQSGDYSRFALNDLFKFLQILFRVGATSTAEELKDIMAVINEVSHDVRGLLNGARGPGNAPPSPQDSLLLNTIQTLMVQASEYLKRMIVSVTKSPKERVAASRNAVKNLRFTTPVTLRNQFQNADALRPMGPNLRVADEVFLENRIPQPVEVENLHRRERQRQQRLRPPAAAPAGVAGPGIVRRRGRGHADPVSESTAPVKLDRDFRAVWGARQGAYYGEELPAPLGYVDPAIHQNRKPVSNSLKPRIQSGAPTFSG